MAGAGTYVVLFAFAALFKDHAAIVILVLAHPVAVAHYEAERFRERYELFVSAGRKVSLEPARKEHHEAAGTCAGPHGYLIEVITNDLLQRIVCIVDLAAEVFDGSFGAIFAEHSHELKHGDARVPQGLHVEPHGHRRLSKLVLRQLLFDLLVSIPLVLSIRLDPNADRRQQQQLPHMFGISASIVRRYVAAEAVTDQIKIGQLHLRAPHFQMVQEVVERFVRLNLFDVDVVARSRTCSHADEVNEDDAEMLVQRLVDFIEESARAHEAVHEHQHRLRAALFPKLLRILIAYDRLNIDGFHLHRRLVKVLADLDEQDLQVLLRKVAVRDQPPLQPHKLLVVINVVL